MPTRRSDRTWPLAILIGFGLMILVNAAFAWIAVRGAEPVAASYVTERR